jgi:16S rRNA (adenine1518-N6/adenine1519-N6)-dimethyltransferase
MKTAIPPSPKKKLGQNFLCDQNMLAKIAAFIHPTTADFILEIGAGTGALTSHLAPESGHYIAVELDADLLPYLQNIDNVQIVNEDIRKVDFCGLLKETSIPRMRIVGNLPYYISSNILTHLISQRQCIQDMILMFQEEVAQRILAAPSDPDYGYLSVIVQYYCKIEKGFKIHRSCFVPKPDIESRILRFEFHPDAELNYDLLSDFLSLAFSQRRKKLRNNLLRALPITPEQLDVLFREMELSENIRAENLSPAQYETMINRLKSLS